MERNQDGMDEFYTSSHSDQHPLLNEKAIGNTREGRGGSPLNGFFACYNNKGLFVLLLISLLANIASLEYGD